MKSTAVDESLSSSMNQQFCSRENQLLQTEMKAFDNDVLLLIVPDSAHTMHTPITLGTLHIDMVIKLATMKELGNLNKQWKRSLIVTK